MSYIKKHKEGFILTLVVHGAILLLLIVFGFFTPLPLPEEKGVLVDFGTSQTGQGKVEPPKQQSTPTKPVEEPVVEEKQTPVPTPTPPTPAVTPDAGKEEVMTQDYEKTAAIEAGKKKAEEERKKKEAEELKEAEEQKRLEEQKRIEEKKLADEREKLRQQQLAEEKKRQDKIKAEQERIAELKRIAEQQRQDSLKRVKDEQNKIAAINAKTKNAFGGETGGNENNSNSTGQGVTYGPGNQGSPTGTPGANRYGDGGGEGVSFNLTGRSLSSLVKPSYAENEEGSVVVNITVDNEGNVLNATAGARGTTSMNQNLWAAAKKAALSTKFDRNPEAAAQQRGTITYKFVLD